MLRDKDLEPLRVVAANGIEWGREHFGALTIGGWGVERSLVKTVEERRRYNMRRQKPGHMRIGKVAVWLNPVHS